MKFTTEWSSFGATRKWQAPDEACWQSDAELLRLFIEQRSDVAFEELVRRHAALVMGVCRRTIGNAHDAEDAFQATFLVLARKAARVRQGSSLASWLYKTAYRIALKARERAARRKEETLEDESMIAADTLDQISTDFQRSALDAELDRLPERYRLPLVLCCIEGKSREEAAEQLGWSIGSLKGRLERARQMLSRRLMLRGITLSLALLAVPTSCYASQATVPGSLIVATAQAGAQYAAGRAVAGYVSQNALTLAHGAMYAMTLSTVKLIACSLALIGGVYLFAQVPVPVMADGASNAEVIQLTSNAGADQETLLAQAPAVSVAIAAVGADGEDGGKRRGKPDHGGKFVSADKVQNVVFVLVNAGEGTRVEKTFDLAKDVAITVDLGKPAELSDLHEGNDLEIWLADDDSTIEAIHATSAVRFGRWRGRDPGNVPKAIDVKQRKVTFGGNEGNSEDRIFPIAEDAIVRIGREEAKLEDLTTEHRVLITLSVDDKTVVQLVQLGRGNEGE